MEPGKELLNSEAVKIDKVDSNGFSCKLCEYWCLYERDFRAHTASGKHMKKAGLKLSQSNSYLRYR